MFPKAHAVAYVTSAFRIAWFKVYHPIAFYIAYFSVRADDFDAAIMANGEDVARDAMKELLNKKKEGIISPKEENVIPILEICIEMYSRGYEFLKIDLYKSHAENFLPIDNAILPPLNALQGIGTNAAWAITDERDKGAFKTVAELKERTGITKTVAELLENYGCFDELPDADQVSFFDA